MPWTKAYTCIEALKAKGFEVKLHGGPDVIAEKLNADEQIEMLLREAVAHANKSAEKEGITVDDYQIAGALWLLQSGNKMLADECGCGKTLQAILAADVLRRMGAKRFLVVAPAYLTSHHWRDQLLLFGQSEDEIQVVRGTPDRKIKHLLEPTLWHIISWDTQHSKRYEPILKAVPWDLVILDESYKMKNRKAKRTQAVLALKARKVVELTGIPADKSPVDMWTQLVRLDRSAFGGYNDWVTDECRTYDMPVHELSYAKVQELARKRPWVYQNRIRVDTNPRTGGKRYRMLVRGIRPGPKNPPSFRRRIAPYVLRRKLREVRSDLPPERDAPTLYIDMHPKQRAKYNHILKEWQDHRTQGLPTAGYSIQLMQCLATTACLDGAGNYSGKHPAALELTEKWLLSDYNVVIWTHWRESIVTLVKALRKLVKRMNKEAGSTTYRVYELWGDIPVHQRGDLVKRWKKNAGSVMVCQPTSSSQGENFVACQPVMDLWLEKHAGSEPYNQGRRRFMRASTKFPVTHWHLVHKDTYDEDVEQAVLAAVRMDKAIDTRMLNRVLEERVAGGER